MSLFRSKPMMLTAAGMSAVWLVSVVLVASGPTTSGSAAASTQHSGVIPGSVHTVAPVSVSQAFQQAARGAAPAAPRPAGQAAAPRPAPTAVAQPGGPQPQMVETVFKNIQVLKGIT